MGVDALIGCGESAAAQSERGGLIPVHAQIKPLDGLSHGSNLHWSHAVRKVPEDQSPGPGCPRNGGSSVSHLGGGVGFKVNRTGRGGGRGRRHDGTGGIFIFAAAVNVNDVAVVDGPSVAFEFSRSLDLDVQEITASGSFNKGTLLSWFIRKLQIGLQEKHSR